ncbi:MAG TPA: ATPase domain-containing protein [Burkholderiales bacterium]|nr:ATPase domain-containing protein [Burkholderiales bacterium]
MKSIRTFHLKVSTGIIGFDESAGRGLPSGRTALLGDRPGSGKTILASRVREIQRHAEYGASI